MTKKELIELYYDIEGAAEERRRLGEFDANSKYIQILLDGLLKVTSNAIENAAPDGNVTPLKRGKKK